MIECRLLNTNETRRNTGKIRRSAACPGPGGVPPVGRTMPQPPLILLEDPDELLEDPDESADWIPAIVLIASFEKSL
jgi:hypothetical protein